jgi:hypothetical protein
VKLKHNHKNIKIIEAANVANENIDAVSVTEHDLLISSEIPKSDFYVSALKSISLRVVSSSQQRIPCTQKPSS